MAYFDLSRTISLAVLITCGTLVIGTIRTVYLRLLRPRWFMSSVPRPSGGTLLRGHQDLLEAEWPGVFLLRSFRELGPVIAFDTSLSLPRIATIDKRAMHHIWVAKSYEFGKAPLAKRILGDIAGEGLLTSEGATHARQRKIMNPSFGTPHLRTIFPILVDKALQLRDALLKTPNAPVDIYDFANRATLDVISAAGFGHEADALRLGDDSSLFHAFNQMFGTLVSASPWAIITRLFPFFQKLTPRSAALRALRHAQSEMQKLSEEILLEKKHSVTVGLQKVKVDDLAGRDLLSALVRANMASDLAPQYKMTDKEVMAQITTFLVAGNDTTANALSWALFGLSSRVQTQERLRAELLAFASDSPTYDELHALPYLDAVVMETLRRFSPVPQTSRVALKDCAIPLEKPFVDTKGIVRHEILVAKNTVIVLPVGASNLDTDLWGPDAADFVPERWLPDGNGGKARVPEGARDLPSTVMPTFLAGPRGCIGWRFAVLELKTMIFTLVRSMEFSLAVKPEDIESRSNVVARPRVISRREESYQLPMLIKPVDDAMI